MLVSLKYPISPKGFMLKLFCLEIGAIFAKNIACDILFNIVFYGGMQMHIIMHNLKMKNRNELKFWE